MKSDFEFVKELIVGSVSAYDELFKIYGIRVYKFAFSYLKSKEDAEEIVQNSFFKIWDRRKTLDCYQCFKTFLFTIAFNEIMTQFRNKAKEKKYREYYLINASAYFDLEQIILCNDLQNQIEKVIQKLPPRRRQIFIMRKEDHLTYKEIAEELGISSKTVENNLNQAVKFLKSRLEKSALLFLFLISL